jgi:hypothetical protein
VTDIGGDFLALRDYLAGDLPADQVRAIEDRLERDPKLVRELELHLRMREGLEQVQAQRERAMAAARRRELRAWTSGLAAAAGCAGLALLLWTQTGGPASSILQTAGQTIPATAASITAQFTFIPVRGASKPELDLPAHGLIELRASPGDAEGPMHYRVTLARQDAQGRPEALGALTGVTVSPDGYLHSYVDASRLSRGDYLLRVEPESKTAGPGAAFQFGLRAQGH